MQEALISSWRSPRTVRTLRLLLTQAEEQQELMDAQRKIEIGQRIKELREASPYPQPVIARAVGVSLRAYQKWEAGGGISYDNAERLANFHGVEVDWILKGNTTDAANLEGVSPADQPNILEQLLREVLSRLDELAGPQGRLAALEEQARRTQADLELLLAEARRQSEEADRARRRRPPQEPQS